MTSTILFLSYWYWKLCFHNYSYENIDIDIDIDIVNNSVIDIENDYVVLLLGFSLFFVSILFIS